MYLVVTVIDRLKCLISTYNIKFNVSQVNMYFNIINLEIGIYYWLY